MLRAGYFGATSSLTECAREDLSVARFPAGAYWHKPDRRTVIKRLGGDLAVLLMIPVWETERGGNRWQVARVISQHMPIILVQPSELDPHKEAALFADNRLPNCWVLRTRYASGPLGQDVEELARHVHDVRWAVSQFGAIRPIYWLFNPSLASLFVELNEGRRIVHATEDWYEFPRPPGTWIDKSALTSALSAADLVVAVSQGVLHSIMEHAPRANAILETNGCNYDVFASCVEKSEIAEELRRRSMKVAVFCGGIDARLRFDLLYRAVQSRTSLALVMIGPVSAGLNATDSTLLEQLRNHPRVLFTGPMEERDVARVYRSSDVGIIPYKPLPHVVKSQFSSKLLEMAASQLPVVTTRMESSKNVAASIHVCDCDDEFLRMLEKNSRGQSSPHERKELASVARKNDYTEKFQRVLIALSKAAKDSLPSGKLTDGTSSAIQLYSQGQKITRQGKLNEGRRMLIAAARDLQRGVGRKHLMARKAIAELARCLLNLGRYLAAIRFIKGALAIRDEMTPSYRIWRVETQVLLAKAMKSVHRLSEEREALRAAWTDSIDPTFHAGYSQSIGLDYVAALIECGDAEAAMQVLEEVKRFGRGKVPDVLVESRIGQLGHVLDTRASG